MGVFPNPRYPCGHFIIHDRVFKITSTDKKNSHQPQNQPRNVEAARKREHNMM